MARAASLPAAFTYMSLILIVGFLEKQLFQMDFIHFIRLPSVKSNSIGRVMNKIEMSSCKSGPILVVS